MLFHALMLGCRKGAFGLAHFVRRAVGDDNVFAHQPSSLKLLLPMQRQLKVAAFVLPPVGSHFFITATYFRLSAFSGCVQS